MPKQNSTSAGDKRLDPEQNEKLKMLNIPVACSTPGKCTWVIFTYEIVTFMLFQCHLFSPSVSFIYIDLVNYIGLVNIEAAMHSWNPDCSPNSSSSNCGLI